jgi:hypothetical protein
VETPLPDSIDGNVDVVEPVVKTIDSLQSPIVVRANEDIKVAVDVTQSSTSSTIKNDQSEEKKNGPKQIIKRKKNTKKPVMQSFKDFSDDEEGTNRNAFVDLDDESYDDQRSFSRSNSMAG